MRVRDRAPSLAPGHGRRIGRRDRDRSDIIVSANADLNNTAVSAIVDDKTSCGAATVPPSKNAVESNDLEEMRQRGVRPRKPGYHETPLLSVGKQVRVHTSESCRCALIECVNDADNTVDVLYCTLDDGLTGKEEEAVVPSSSVRPLEDFEIWPEGTLERAFEKDLYVAVAQTKEHGNVLFKMQDYESAAHTYGLAIDELFKFIAPHASSESWVLMNHDGALVLGSVRSVDTDSQKADVALYRADVDQIQIFSGAPWRTLISVHEDHLVLQSSLYMNRAKSLVQVGFHQEAAQDLTVAIGLWAARDEGARRGGGKLTRPLSNEEVKEQREQLTKAYYLRAKTRLARTKLDLARGDLREARTLQPSPAMGALLQQLERDIEIAEKESVRSNKKIAKEISKWADTALSTLDGSALAALEGVDSGRGGGGLCPSQTHSPLLGTWVYGDVTNRSTFTITRKHDSTTAMHMEQECGAGRILGTLQPDGLADAWHVAEVSFGDGAAAIGTLRLRLADDSRQSIVSSFRAPGAAEWSTSTIAYRRTTM